MDNTRDDCWDYLIKLLVVGPSKGGKSSLIRRFIYEDQGLYEVNTNSQDFFVKNIISPYSSKTIRLQIFEYSGSIGIEAFYRGIDGVMIVYDSTDIESQKSIDSYFSLIKKFSPDNVKTILVASKTDLKNINVVEIQHKASVQDNGLYLKAETSAKENLGVDSAFFTLITSIEQEIMQSRVKNNNDNEIVLGQSDKTRKCCFC